MALPSQVLYNMKPESVPSRSLKTSFLSSAGAGSITAAGQAKIHVSGNRGEYLDCPNSMLRFSVTNPTNSAATMILDGHASCFIERVEIYFNSTLVESISAYNVLYGALYDASASTEQRVGGDAIIAGTCDNPSGGGGVTIRYGKSLAAGETAEFQIPLLGCLGTHAEKYLPLGFGELRIELTMAPFLNAVVSTAPAHQFTISNINYDAQIIRVDASAQMNIEAALPGGQFQIHGSSFRSYNGTIANQPANSTSHLNMYVPANFASVKTVIATMRESALIGDGTKFCISHRTTNGVKSWYVRCGSENYPQTPVQGVVQSYVELLKARHSLATGDYQYSIGPEDWAQENAGGIEGSFMMALDLEAFSGKSGVMMSGKDTTNSQLFLVAEFTVAQARSVVVDTFVEFDQVLYIDANSQQATVRF